jgi:hypothetical protein
MAGGIAGGCLLAAFAGEIGALFAGAVPRPCFSGRRVHTAGRVSRRAGPRALGQARYRRSCSTPLSKIRTVAASRSLIVKILELGTIGCQTGGMSNAENSVQEVLVVLDPDLVIGFGMHGVGSRSGSQ